MEQQVERPQLKIEPKREMLAKYGVTLPQFGDIVNVMLGGEAVSQVYEENRSFDLTLKVNDASRASAERIRKLIVDANGRKVPLENIANVTSSMGPNTISRENVARKIVISANVAGRDLRGVVNDIQSKVDSEIQLPEGYHIEYYHFHFLYPGYFPALVQRVQECDSVIGNPAESATCTDWRCVQYLFHIRYIEYPGHYRVYFSFWYCNP